MSRPTVPGTHPWRAAARDLRPMLATPAAPPLTDPRLAYEPKYDGIRALVEIEPGRGAAGVRIWSRLGNEKTAQFPEIVRALAQFGRKLRAPVLLDGEIVALDDDGEPTSFQRLQGRVHLSSVGEHEVPGGVQVAFIAFDVLRDGGDDLTGLPLGTRRARLDRIFGIPASPLFRLGTYVVGDGRRLYDEAMRRGWEGLLAKRLESQYRPGRRTTDWSKIKIIRQQEFVVGGWTEPRGSRPCFGALLLGVYEGAPRTRPRLVYVGHAGSGFSDRELERVWKLLKDIETSESPFAVPPAGNERVHWVRPVLVAQVKFTEWTDERLLRHPTYLGLRDDVRPEDVRREESPRVPALPVAPDDKARRQTARRPSKRAAEVTAPGRKAAGASAPGSTAEKVTSAQVRALLEQLDVIDDRGGNGRLQLPDGHTLDITNLKKVFWPDGRLTKGDLLRYYVRVAPYILPVVADRPLVMKRLPNGIRSQTFYQQRAPEKVPAGVRVESLAVDDEVPSRLIGGSLVTLLYMTQLAAISQDPWFSRVGSIDAVDHVALDLDPMPGVPFTQVLDVARWAHDEMRRLKLEGYAKTSGSNGLHIFIPLPPGTSYEIGLLFCQIIATVVADRHPKQATVERAVHARGLRVYVDYLQNIQGKTLACAYSARGSDYAGVSTPLTWKEIHAGVDREAFTIRTVPARLARVGDLWGRLLTSKGVDLRALEKRGRR